MALIVWTGAALASDLPAPEGPVLLHVTGEISVTNQDGAAAFDLDLLRGIGAQTIETTTIWTDGVQTFEGVPLHDLTKALGITGSALRATAVNDYAVDIPLADAVPGGAFLAFARNGRPMSVRDKGPLWVIYPYDSAPRYQAEIYYARSIWQLDRIEVLP
ncbi:molybdopterin-dependent oxidoreductase [Tropicibacter naphthalenivorans]|nr:molybdopterin-dependent oxidoreductase [Tropicibacter naphthalenivorans]